MTKSKPSCTVLDISPKKQTSIRLSNRASYLRDQLASWEGLSKSDILEIALREMYESRRRKYQYPST